MKLSDVLEAGLSDWELKLTAALLLEGKSLPPEAFAHTLATSIRSSLSRLAFLPPAWIETICFEELYGSTPESS